MYNLGRNPKNDLLGFGVSVCFKSFSNCLDFDFDAESLIIFTVAPVYKKSPSGTNRVLLQPTKNSATAAKKALFSCSGGLFILYVSLSSSKFAIAAAALPNFFKFIII